ncbi:MAG: hypothetical protein E7449_05460 [Ruminococcaceae bacterium]|nr:hypothetical protein [Oscillospiraceae bacterium]
MKQHYKHMMDQFTLPESALDALLTQPVEKKRPVHVLRTVMIAACVCALLLGATVAATHLNRVSITNVQSSVGASGYQVDVTLGQYRMQDLGKALRTDLQNDSLSHSFASQKQLERYLGVQLVDSAALEQAELVGNLEQAFAYGFDLYPELSYNFSAPYILIGSTLDGTEVHQNPELLQVTWHRVVRNTEVYMTAKIITEHADPADLAAGLPGEAYEPIKRYDMQIILDEFGNPQAELIEYESAAHEFRTSTFQMKNGLVATIVTSEELEPDGSYGFTEYIGYFVKDGILYSVKPYAIYDPHQDFPMDDTDSLIVLKEVLNLFE